MSETTLSAMLDAAKFDENEPVLPFPATYDGERYMVKAIHFKTADLKAVRDGYVVTLRTETVMVDTDHVQWRAKPGKQPIPEVPALRVVSPPHEEKEAMTTRISTTERQELAARGLKRCFKCKRDLPLAELNSGGFCRDGLTCRAIQAGQPADKARADGVQPKAFATGGVVGSPMQIVEPAPLAELVTNAKRTYKKRKKGRRLANGAVPISRVAAASLKASGHKNRRPALTLSELIGDLKKHLAALKSECDQLRAEKADLFSQLQELVASA
jgi:hypothetical protein